MHLPTTPGFRLDGKRAFVAGASSGIGLSCAVALAEAGAQIVLAARSTDKLQDTVAAFSARGWKAEPLPLDISDVDAMAAAIATRPAFDILVNSAGVARHSAASETTVEDFDAVMDLNVRGAYFLTQAVAKKLIAEKRTGSLMNISSTMGQVGGIDRAVYCASKHALEGFTKAMAIEWGPHGIRVNTISPTFIRTPLTQATFDNPERRRWMEDKIKLGRVGEVEDVMAAVVYLASDASALVTGTTMLIDGGWTAG
jgi:NAD(P)-dependent dehydrogenase (short-subunit alcohol dehydrogenase family)